MFVELVRLKVFIIFAFERNRSFIFVGLSTIGAFSFSVVASLLLTVTGPSTLKIMK